MSLTVKRQRRAEYERKRVAGSRYSGGWTAEKQRRLIAILKRDYAAGWCR